MTDPSDWPKADRRQQVEAPPALRKVVMKDRNGTLIDVQACIAQRCDAIKELLLEKNRKYGNSALEPLIVFGRKLSPLDSIRVRINDKLKRIQNGNEDTEDEDTVQDLIGYLVLYQIGKELGLT